MSVDSGESHNIDGLCDYFSVVSMYAFQNFHDMNKTS